MSHDLSSYGRDEATGCSFLIGVSPAEVYYTPDGHELLVGVHCNFSSPSSEGPIPHPNYEENWYDLQDPERRSTLWERLNWWLDHVHVPLAAKNDTIRLIFDYMSTHEAVDGVFVRTVMCYGSDLDHEDGEEEEEVRRIADLTMQEDSMRRTPASREAVEALEKVTIRGAEKDTSCTVCLEVFLEGSEATMMPCLHVFHGECIERWLEDRRFCPLCRFELPLAEELSCAEQSVLEDTE